MLCNNPAARLHQILTLCKKHEKESGHRPMLVGWRKVFRMPDSIRDFTVMERIGRVYGLAETTAESIGRHEELDPQLYLGWREELEEAFLNLSFRSEFQTFVHRIPRTLLVNLEFCSNALSDRSPEPVVEAERLAELGTLTGELVKEVGSADLEQPQRCYFQDYLQFIRKAIADYPLTGAAGLQGAIDACTGTLVTRRQVSIATREMPVGRKFWSLIQKLSRSLAPPSDAEDAQAREPNDRATFKAIVRRRAA